MRTVIYDESSPMTKQELAEALLYDENDPRSNSYKRVLVRPEIRWGLVICFFCVWAALAAAIALVMLRFGIETKWIVLAAVFATLAYIALFCKQIVITAIRIYQRYAPDALRNKCRFEPSCSEYMLLAIRKYGLVKGVRKGIERLKRCNTSSGGYDMP